MSHREPPSRCPKISQLRPSCGHTQHAAASAAPAASFKSDYRTSALAGQKRACGKWMTRDSCVGRKSRAKRAKPSQGAVGKTGSRKTAGSPTAGESIFPEGQFDVRV